MRRFALLAVSLVAAAGVRGEIVLTGSNAEVVVDRAWRTRENRGSVVNWTAVEMTNLLGRILSAEIPIVTEPTPGKVSIVLGTNSLSAAAGVAPWELPRDGYVIRAGSDGRVYIAGCDDPRASLEKRIELNAGSPHFECATAFGMYEFLERFAGVRFYFPGELGTIIPKADAIHVPSGTDLKDSPDYIVRYFVPPSDSGAWYGSGWTNRERSKMLALERLRMRMETEHIPVCHGQWIAQYTPRFAKSHPEYFILKEDGKRDTRDDYGDYRNSQMCQSSDIWEEIYLDAKCYLTGGSPRERGYPPNAKGEYVWGPHAVGGRYFDVMPTDGMLRCRCEKCTKAYEQAADKTQWASDLVWRQTDRVARRLKADGIRGCVCQMVYSPYRRVPDFDLSDNIKVMVGTVGPWSYAQPETLRSQTETVKAWDRKLGTKVFLWTYEGKYDCLYLNIPDVPLCAPRLFGRYFKEMAPYICGAYAESKTDRWIYHYQDFYVFSKVCWDNGTDVDALLDEHDRLMFGAGAKPMRRFFDLLERKWVYEVAGKTVATPIGDVASPPDDYGLWYRVYDRKTLAELKGDLKDAVIRVGRGTVEAKRIALMKSEFYDPLVKRATAYLQETDPAVEVARRAAGPVKSVLADGGWYLDREHFDGKVIGPTGKPSHRIDATGGASYFAYVFNNGKEKALKPRTRYRLSYFTKGALRATSRGGGHMVVFRTPNFQKAYPDRTFLSGDFDWVHQSFVLETGDDILADGKRCEVMLRTANCEGQIWFSDVILEEQGK